MVDLVPSYLANNIKQLRLLRNLTQDQLSKLSKIPRTTLTHLESGEANPTLSVLVSLARAFQIPFESLITPPRSTSQFYSAKELPYKVRNRVTVRQLLPDSLGSLELDRMEFEPKARMVGAPHKSGTREYLTCEMGHIELIVSGESWQLRAGDVVVFRGDQKHSYQNLLDDVSVGYSIILIG